ncbi:MAG: DNA polymerase III subunit gamma/tau [Candidatus Omnitrophica bacterium]|nr:DNA polymerase III subunit gamma/tau [Candidatus Omnitrophota bacterium]
MSYLAFALKYRPKIFSEVVGQEHVVASLENAIRSQRVHHAYLFSGPRGVGKTSLARILARSLNCFEGPTLTPCGKCLSCVEITKGQSLDIIEIDGASNRGIDDIRILRENVKLSAANSRYKIYIIDEVHMLTQEAFNALLKTLEEPPAHVKFIFATTHPHKVIPTILSRCQKFQFNLISLEKIVDKLKKIITEEKVKIKDNLLYTIGRAAGGSIRDAESLLDQLTPIVLEKGSLEDIFSFLGIIDEESLNQAIKSLIEKDLPACLSFVDKTVKDGKDLGAFLNAFIEHIRNLLLAKISLKNFKELSDISPQSKEFIAKLSEAISISDILKIIDLLIEAKELSQRLNTVKIPLELALIKYAQPVSVDVPKKNNPTASSKPLEDKELKLNIDMGDFDLEADDDMVGESKHDIKGEMSDGIEEGAPSDNTLLGQLKNRWKEVLASMQRKRAALASHLSFAQPVSSRGSLVTIAFSPQDYFHKECVENGKNLKFIEEAISKFINKAVGVKFALQDLPDAPSPVTFDNSSDNEREEREETENAPKSEKTKNEGVEDDTFLNELLDTFGGKFHSDE